MDTTQPKRRKYTKQPPILLPSSRSSRASVDVSVPNPNTADHDLIWDEFCRFVILAVDNALELDTSDDPLVLLIIAIADFLILGVFVGSVLSGSSGVMLRNRGNLEPHSEKVIDVA
jgi:hypothetical protein